MSGLQLIRTDFQKSKNTVAHHTSDYDYDNLVIRRGQPWTLELTLSRALQSTDALTIMCETGPSASVQRNTKAEMPVSSSGSKTSWSAVRGQSSNNVLPITMMTPVNGVIGLYKMTLQIKSGVRTTTAEMGSFVLLFNSWIPEDEVYMSNDAERNEYILNEYGLYWFGSYNSFGQGTWDYAQFEKDVLKACLTMLDRNLNYRNDAATDVSQRNDPAYVARVLSAMVNSNNDNGVVVGNWTPPYDGGVSPTTWNGSAAILRQWLTSGPVKYGQCWVFGGVLCTVCRCLGIPTRLIVNFESAHNADENLDIDKYYDEFGNPLGDTTDSIWNFHVWNECWFVRKDLGSDFNGWQIMDATPQEPSQGLYRLGPCPQKAVKEGDIDIKYDVQFVFCEVNADIKYWVKYKDGMKRVFKTETNKVGMRTSTKDVGANRRKDITEEYKYAEGTPEERKIFQKAKNKLNTFSLMSRTAAAEAPPINPQFSCSFRKGTNTQVGEDLSAIMVIKNQEPVSQKIEIKVSAMTIIYNNTPFKTILSKTQTITLEPNEEKNVEQIIMYDTYKGSLTHDNMIKLSGVCTDERGGALLVEIVYTLTNPKLLMRVSGQPKVNQRTTVDVIFTNPLKATVEESVLICEGSGMLRNQLITKVPPLKPYQRATVEFDIDPYRAGNRCLLADFNSKQFTNVKAVIYTTVAR
ncbi:protein-glutamine gamma-glutamyltransferase E-like [Gastrophryne carolinensis]